MTERRAIYAGSFDLLTNGHLWMIEQGVNLFGCLTVAVGVNPAKQTMFTAEQRVAMLGAATEDLRVEVIELPPVRFLAEYAGEHGYTHLLRGIRSVADFEFEQAMRAFNADINPEVETVVLLPPAHLLHVSSSVVKSLLGCDGWEAVVQQYVPRPVLDVLVSESLRLGR